MKRSTLLSIAILLIANIDHSTLGYAQNSSQNITTACPAATEVSALHLYGAWQARWDGSTETATLTLGRNPEHPDGVRGSILRGTSQALVAGDVDDGDFTLEESTDGRTIAATWTGKVVDKACGKEIQGTWTNASDSTERRFVLRKQPGWQ